MSLRREGKWNDDFNNAKVLSQRLDPGDAFSFKSGGGGGFGSPLERPIGDVAEDVRQGYVSLESALEDYGVVCDPATLTVDQDASSNIRSAKATLAAAQGKPDR